MAKSKTKTSLDQSQITNGAESLISMTAPYIVKVTLQGITPILFHAWNSESIEERSRAPKNSAVRKSDDLESMVYRTDDGHLGIQGSVLQGALVEAGRHLQDPRSPRKSARDLIKSAIQVLTIVAPFEPQVKEWDYEDRRRVVVQRSGVTRTRPAMKEGWRVSFEILVNAPEYFSESSVQDLLTKAGLFSGLCDYRPTYGRFRVVAFLKV